MVNYFDIWRHTGESASGGGGRSGWQGRRLYGFQPAIHIRFDHVAVHFQVKRQPKLFYYLTAN
ncbi:MAG: hypothetical protein L0Y75_00680 [Acidobacteria bacterium]|nr:hypothetical protein [Acidobacteriota bacterium]